MDEKNYLIKKLELFSKITFWISVISVVIILFIALQSFSAGNNISDMTSVSQISGVISSITGFFTLMALILASIGVTVSYIAKSIAIFLKDDFNLPQDNSRFKKNVKQNTNVIQDEKYSDNRLNI